jgi:transmembrane sensor
MKPQSEPARPEELPDRVRFEAAAWLMRMHSPDRTRKDDEALRQWLAESPAHRAAFETGSDMWTAAETLPVSVIGRISPGSSRTSAAPTKPYRWALAASALVIAVLAAILFRLREPVVSTGVGESRTRVLADGTRIMLNTSTHLTVQYDDRIRRVTLDAGEALFDVAKDPARPFIVRVGDQQVTALGTSFIVRRDDARTAVILVEGKVSVAPVTPASSGTPSHRLAPTLLNPGERLTLDHAGEATLDRPPLEKVTAWKQGHVAFVNTPLPDAIKEMNRYSERKLVMADPGVAPTRVSGIFRVAESESFALALSNTYPLRILERDGQILIYAAGADAQHSPP